MTERHVNSDKARPDSLTYGEEAFNPETASVLDLSLRIAKIAGKHDPTDPTGGRTHSSWQTGINGISCSLSTWEIEHEPDHLLVVSSEQKSTSYTYGAYMSTVQYTDTDTATVTLDQREIEERLARVLRHGYKQIIERQIYDQFDQISGRIAVEELIENQQEVRTLRLGRVANAQASLDPTTLMLLANLHCRDNKFCVPDIVFKTAMMGYYKECKHELSKPQSSRESTLRRLINKLKSS